MHPNHTRFLTVESIKQARKADLRAWCEWNDRNGEFDGMRVSELRAAVALMRELADDYWTALDLFTNAA